MQRCWNIDEVNASIEERLRMLQQLPAIESLDSTVNELNRLLFSLIWDHASLAARVHIKATANVDRACPDLYQGGAREWLKEYLQMVNTKKLAGLVSFEFVTHAPFRFSTGTPGSGERAAWGASFENMAFSVGCERRYAPVDFALDLACLGGLLSKNVLLLPQEITSIQVCSAVDVGTNDGFSPTLISLPNREEIGNLGSQRSPIEQYLFFKGFYATAVWKEIQILKSRFVRIHVPDSIPLFYEDSRRVNGFVAAMTRLDREWKLYTFENVQVPKNISPNIIKERSVLAAYLIAQNYSSAVQGIKVYTEQELIPRLHEVRLERRF